jgi:hypothetical protein
LLISKDIPMDEDRSLDPVVFGRVFDHFNFEESP